MKKVLNIFPSILEIIDENETFLLLHMAKHMDIHRKAFPGRKKLQQSTRWGRDKVKRVMDSLRDKGLLTWNQKIVEGRFSTNQYKVLTDKIGIFIDMNSINENPDEKKTGNNNKDPMPENKSTGVPDFKASDDQSTKYSNSSEVFSSSNEEDIKEINKESRDENDPVEKESFPGRNEAHAAIDFFEAYTGKRVRLRSDSRLKAIISRMKEMKLTMIEVKLAIMWQYQSSQKYCKLDTIFRPKNAWIFDEALSDKWRSTLEKRLEEFEPKQSIPAEEKEIPRSEWTQQEKEFVMEKTKAFHEKHGTIGDYTAQRKAIEEHGNPSILTKKERQQLKKA